MGSGDLPKALEKENLEDLLADLIQLKETTPSLVARVDSAQAPQASSSEKSTNLKTWLKNEDRRGSTIRERKAWHA